MSGLYDDDRPGLVLGPDEIVNYPLRKATRGYQVKEVDDLLDQLAVQTQRLLEAVQRLEDEREQLRQQLAAASESESFLKKTLVTAQRAAEASVAEAHEEAEQLRIAARERIEQLLADAAGQAHELREAALRRARADEADVRRYRREVEEHIEALRTFAEDHRARLAHHLELQQQRLDQMELPPPPPEPSREQDHVLEDDVESVDLDQIMAELHAAAGTEAAAERPQDGDGATEPREQQRRDGDAEESVDDGVGAPLFEG